MPGRKTRSFGTIRKLPSGRWQARYRGPDGMLRSAPSTFARKTDAARWLALTEAELAGGGWIDPDAGRVPFIDYATAWISERPGLRPKTLQLYRYLLRRHLAPGFAAQTIAGITEADVRRWRADLLTAGVTPVTAAKAYRLLKAIMATAVDDGLIRRNPCRVKGAGTEKSPERPVLTVTQVYALADAPGPRYRALILLACFCGLRWGELAALRRCDIDTETGTVRVARQLTEVLGQPPIIGPPKSDAGRRTVVVPAMILPDVTLHLASFTPPDSDALAFTSPGGKPLRHSNFRSRIWLPALAATDLPGIHFHDLRHAGNLFIANAGANLRELMERMGHSSSRAALIYLHSTNDRQRTLADAVADRARTELEEHSRGTGVARTGTEPV
ncbi:MAG: tyrosine-type recombinase/integrase [Streptosporangiaceae bacterium]|jgi:integrase